MTGRFNAPLLLIGDDLRCDEAIRLLGQHGYTVTRGSDGHDLIDGEARICTKTCSVSIKGFGSWPWVKGQTFLGTAAEAIERARVEGCLLQSRADPRELSEALAELAEAAR